MFPIHCPQSDEHPDGHWTLLVLESCSEGSVSLRYYDGLNEPNGVCLSRAKKLVEWHGLEQEVERVNTFRQDGDDCIWWVCHYAELESRAYNREGWGACRAIGHPERKDEIREKLKRGAEQLEAARLKWLEKQAKEDAQLEALRAMVEKQRGRQQFLQDELERLRGRAKAAAEACLRGAENLPDPEFEVEKKKKVSGAEQLREIVEAALEEMSKEELEEEAAPAEKEPEKDAAPPGKGKSEKGAPLAKGDSDKTGAPESKEPEQPAAASQA